MQITRRQFSKLSGSFVLALTAISSAFLTGCGIFSDILTWTSIAAVAIDGIVRVLGPLMPPGGALAVTALKAFLADLAAAITEYQNDTNPADKATLLAKIRTLLGDIATNFQSFLDQLNLGINPVVQVVIGLAQVILSAIMGFLGQLPPPAVAAAPRTFKLGVKALVVIPKYYKHTKDFVHDYNLVCDTNGHPEIKLH